MPVTTTHYPRRYRIFVLFMRFKIEYEKFSADKLLTHSVVHFGTLVEL